MKFENGIWLGALSNARMNKYLFLGCSAAMLAAIFLNPSINAGLDSTYLTVLLWSYLAIPAHYTALRGQSGMLAIGSGAINWGFITRATALFFAGSLGAFVTVAFLGAFSNYGAIVLVLGVYLIGELFVFSLLGTWLPAVVDDGDGTLKAAFRRGQKTFTFAFSRLLFCDGALVFVGIFALGTAIQMLGFDDNWSDVFGSGVLMVAIMIFAMLILSFHVVMLATILSRAYLIAENRNVGSQPALSLATT